MPALIGNYTVMPEVTTRNTTEVVVFNWMCYDKSMFNGSIVLSTKKSFNINKRIEYLLNEYSQLTRNWDDDDALPPTEKVIEEAQNLTTILSCYGQAIYHAAPGPDGEIMLNLRNHNNTKSLEIILYHNKRTSVKFPESGVPTQETFTMGDLPELIRWLNK